MTIDNFNKFNSIGDNQLEQVEGGFVVTGAAVAAGLAIFATSYKIGYSMGSSFKNRRK